MEVGVECQLVVPASGYHRDRDWHRATGTASGRARQHLHCGRGRAVDGFCTVTVLKVCDRCLSQLAMRAPPPVSQRHDFCSNSCQWVGSADQREFARTVGRTGSTYDNRLIDTTFLCHLLVLGFDRHVTLMLAYRQTARLTRSESTFEVVFLSQQKSRSASSVHLPGSESTVQGQVELRAASCSAVYNANAHPTTRSTRVWSQLESSSVDFRLWTGFSYWSDTLPGAVQQGTGIAAIPAKDRRLVTGTVVGELSRCQ
jgi:hypothetical protein